jgi:sulfopyruvate decarboxylase subunit alpha
MTYFIQNVHAVEELCRELVAAGFSPFVGAQCEALSSLREALDLSVGVLTVPRDDNAIGIAAGVALAGGFPAVLLRNTGPGISAEVIASVVAPHEVPMLLVVALDADSATGTDAAANRTAGNDAMVRLSATVLAEFGIESVPLDPTARPAGQVDVVRAIVIDQLRPAALLVPAGALGRPA